MGAASGRICILVPRIAGYDTKYDTISGRPLVIHGANAVQVARTGQDEREGFWRVCDCLPHRQTTCILIAVLLSFWLSLSSFDKDHSNPDAAVLGGDPTHAFPRVISSLNNLSRGITSVFASSL